MELIIAQRRLGQLALQRAACMLSARAVAEILSSCSATRAGYGPTPDFRFAWVGLSGALSSGEWLKAATISSALAGLARYWGRAQFDCLDGGGDAGITGQHDDARIRIEAVQ